MRLAFVFILAACQGPPGWPLVDLDADSVQALDTGVTLDIEVNGPQVVQIASADRARLVEVAIAAETTVITRTLSESGPSRCGDVWLRPRPVHGSLLLELRGHGTAHITVWSRGAPIAPVDPDRSVVWHEPVPLDNASVIGLGRLMAAVAPDGHGGRLFDRWLQSFATTPYSQRTMPAQFMADIRATHGDSPDAWDLDTLPFRVTAVHNRVDLWGTEGACGQLRVTMASTHPTYAPLHLIFLFTQPARDDDVAPDGTVHCLGTARRWSRLSPLDEAGFVDAAGDWLDEALQGESFLMAESLEREDDIWEWRQWLPVASSEPGVDIEFINPPLFQTVDVAAVNQTGPLRDDFLAFVAENAEALRDHDILIPERFRAPVARMTEGASRPELDLGGLDPEVAGAYPRLGEHIEIMGCVRCHTTPAPEFVQTYPERFFSDFHFHEVEARAALLDAMNAGDPVEPPRFGPLQPF